MMSNVVACRPELLASKMAKTSHLFIVGAGFSYNAGLPLTGDFTKALLNLKGLRLDGPSSLIVKYLRSFVDVTFGNGASTKSDNWPVLEDIFTLIDLSANTGHHLGSDFSPAELRTVRRALIVRFIRMLLQRYNQRKNAPDNNWRRLETLLKRLNLQSTAVLSLNWDCVVEWGLARTQAVNYFDYGCDARAASFVRGKFGLKNEKASRSFQLLKPHGSINWLYCDACRELYWLPPGQSEQVAQTLFRKRDWATVKAATEKRGIAVMLNPACPVCGSFALGTRLATFSYRKALDFPMHAATWRQAEALLREADTWIFFGYSMPGADFEFKHLLKRVELSRRKKPHIVLVTGGDGAKITKTTYKNFFGSDENAPFSYHSEGLTPAVLKDLTDIGVLRPTQIKLPSKKRG